MTLSKRSRLWMRAETGTKAKVSGPTRGELFHQSPHLPARSVELADAPALAVLMDRAYTGTIDHQGETPDQCLEEIRATLTGK